MNNVFEYLFFLCHFEFPECVRCLNGGGRISES